MASILQFADHLPVNDPLRLWVAAAAARRDSAMVGPLRISSLDGGRRCDVQ